MPLNKQKYKNKQQLHLKSVVTQFDRGNAVEKEQLSSLRRFQGAVKVSFGELKIEQTLDIRKYVRRTTPTVQLLFACFRWF